MPGVVCVIGDSPERSEIAEDVALQVYGYDPTVPGQLYDDDKIAIRLVGTPNGEPTFLWDYDPWIVAGIGYASTVAGWEDALNAVEKVLSRDVAFDGWPLRGHFQLLIYNTKTKSARLIGDKVSTHPWYFARVDNVLVGTPDPMSFRVLRRRGWDGAIDTGIIPQFMASGHPWGDTTYLQGVRRLGPGSAISYEDGRVQEHTYWKMEYAPKSIPREERIEQLIAAMKSDIRNVPSGKGLITLSGGMDSRAALGLALQAGLDVEAVSYTFGIPNLPQSDADVAGKIARIAGIRCQIVQTRPEVFVPNFFDVLTATGAESDVACNQESFLGRGFYEGMRRRFSFLIRGDEVWGWGDNVRTFGDAFMTTLLFNLTLLPHPRRLLEANAMATYTRQIDELHVKMRGEFSVSKGIEMNDLKDFLYWRHREARLLQNMAYFRRTFIPHIAPFLLDDTLDVIRTLPAEDRIRKSLFIDASKRMFPELFVDFKQKVSTERMGLTAQTLLADNKELRELVVDALLDDLPDELAAVFRPDKLRVWVSEILNPVQPQSASRGRKLYNILHLVNRNLRRLPGVRTFLLSLGRKTGTLRFPVVNANYLLRLMVLSLGIREYKKTPQ